MAVRMSVQSAVNSMQAIRAHLDELAGNKRSLTLREIDDPLLLELAKYDSVSTSTPGKVSVRKMREVLGTMEQRVANADKDGDGQLGHFEAGHLTPLMTRIMDRADRGHGVSVDTALKGIAQIKRQLETLAGDRSTIQRTEIADPNLLLFANFNWINRSEEPPATVSVAQMHKEIALVESKIKHADLDANGLINFTEDGLFMGPDGIKFLDAAVLGIDGPRMSQAELDKHILSFVSRHCRDNAEELRLEELFPARNSGENGLTIHTFPGNSGDRMAAFAKLFDRNNETLKGFDPQRHALCVVQGSEDEVSLYVAITDRSTGESTFATDINLVDTSYEMTREEFEANVAPVGELGIEDWEEVGQWELIELLTAESTTQEPVDHYDLLDMTGVKLPFDPEEYDGWTGEIDWSDFSAPIHSFENIDKDLGTLIQSNHYNSRLYDAGLSREGIRAIYQELKHACPDMTRSEIIKFNLEGLRKLYDEAGNHIGHEIRFSDADGIIGGSVYLTPDNQTVSGYGS